MGDVIALIQYQGKKKLLERSAIKSLPKPRNYKVVLDPYGHHCVLQSWAKAKATNAIALGFAPLFSAKLK